MNSNFIVSLIFAARNMHELMCRPSSTRFVVNAGKLLDVSLPPFSDLDPTRWDL